MQQGIDITPRSISGRIVGELEILDLSANTMLCLAAIYRGDSNISPALLKVWTLPYERHRYSHIILITNTNQDCSPPLSSRGLPHSHYHYTQDESWSRLAQLLVRGHICDPFYPIIYHSLKPKNIKRFTGHGWADAQVLSLLMGFYKICDTNPWKIST